jgi:hypothetical protein
MERMLNERPLARGNGAQHPPCPGASFVNMADFSYVKNNVSLILCEKACPPPKFPHIKDDKHRELRDSTKCEEKRNFHKTKERNEPPHGIPHNSSEKIREMCDPQPEIPQTESVLISELCNTTKCESESIQAEIREMSDPPTKKEGGYPLTKTLHSSSPLHHVQILRSYLDALLQRWEKEIKEQLWGTWSTTTHIPYVRTDFHKEMEVLNEVKQKQSSILLHPEVCTYEHMKQWRDEIKKKLFVTSCVSSIQQYMFVNLRETTKELLFKMYQCHKSFQIFLCLAILYCPRAIVL